MRGTGSRSGRGQAAAALAATTRAVSAWARSRFSVVSSPERIEATHWARGLAASAGTSPATGPLPTSTLMPPSAPRPYWSDPVVPWISIEKGLVGVTKPVSITPIAPSVLVTVTTALSSTPRPVMSGYVAERPRSSVPRLRRVRQAGHRAGVGEPHARVGDAAQRLLGEHPLQGQGVAVRQTRQGHGDPHALRAGGGEQLFALLHGGGQQLLGEHVLAGRDYAADH